MTAQKGDLHLIEVSIGDTDVSQCTEPSRYPINRVTARDRLFHDPAARLHAFHGLGGDRHLCSVTGYRLDLSDRERPAIKDDFSYGHSLSLEAVPAKKLRRIRAAKR